MKTTLKTLLCGALVFASATVYAQNVKVLSVTGKVEVNRNSNWVPVTTNFILSEGEVISTGFNSQAVFSYNGSTFKVGPLTRITLEKLASQEQKDDVSLYVSTGAVRSTVRHTDNKRVTYTVRNPVAVASVRGTDFTFLGNGKVNCYEGAVSLSPASSFNAKERGISKPADGQEGASAEDIAAAAAAVPAEGSSSVTTPAGAIDPFGNTGTVVAAGQTSEINTTTGTPNPGRGMAQSGLAMVGAKGSLPSSAEAVSAGAPQGRQPGSPVAVNPAPSTPGTSPAHGGSATGSATISVTITVEE